MPADIAALLAEAPWLARLARSLTGDGAEADDLVQDTYAAALRSPPDTERPLRPWLRRVAVNLARMRHRGRTRRAANERVVEVQADPVRTPEQLVERAQLERRSVSSSSGLTNRIGRLSCCAIAKGSAPSRSRSNKVFPPAPFAAD